MIPAKHEFLAVLGDQKRGTNVEAPLDAIIDDAATASEDLGVATGDMAEAASDGVERAGQMQAGAMRDGECRCMDSIQHLGMTGFRVRHEKLCRYIP